MFNGALHAAFATIIGGQGQFPCAELLVQAIQIGKCGIGGGNDVAATIVPGVFMQAIVFAGGRQKLPDTRGMTYGIRHRVVGTFYHG